jgi:hypothetical protein
MEPVGFEVVRETTRTTDSRNKHRLFRLELFCLEESLYRRVNGVVTAAGTPPCNGALVITHREFAVVIDAASQKRWYY